MLFPAVPALLVAGTALAQGDGRASVVDPRAAVPRLEYRSALEGYRSFVEEDLRDWRKSNEEVGMAGGHAGHRPGQGPGAQTSKPQPGKPEGAGGPAEKRGGSAAPAHGGHK